MFRAQWFGVLLGGLAFVGGSAVADGPPELRREFRGVWVATVENIDWPSRRDLTPEEQRRELVELLDQAKRLHLNAIILQVRPACDALYTSTLEPWSVYLTGEAGRAPEPWYDPLDFAVAQAHQRGLELHVWFNPYRARHASFDGTLPPNHVIHAHPTWVRSYGKYGWLDPGVPAAAEHSLAVISDVVRRYDVDGVHMDDYFYPYPIVDDEKNEVPFPDDDSYQNRSQQDRELSRGDWRRANVDRFIENMYRRVKEIKPWVKVGISPFGIWRPGHPPGIQGFDQFDKLSADARRWLDEGWLDYITPQLYWPIDRPAQSYPVLLEWWHQQNRMQRHLWPGNYTSRLAQDDPVWTPEEIVRQIERTRQQAGATGNVHFSMKAFLDDYRGINGVLLDGVYAEPALIPASPWLGEDPPLPPSVRVDTTDQRKAISWEAPGGEPPFQWVVQWHGKDGWQSEILGGEEHHRDIPPDSDQIVVYGVSRVGIAGEPFRVEVDRKDYSPRRSP